MSAPVTVRTRAAPGPAPVQEPDAAPAPGRARGGWPLAATLLTAAALGVWGALHWAGQVGPAANTELLAALAAGLLTGLGARRLRGGPLAALGGAALGLAALAAGFVAAGIPLQFLTPDAWPDLADRIGQAVSAFPSIRVPYEGVDEWIRWTIVLGGTVLVALGAHLALQRGGGARAAGLIALAVLYAVPAVEQDLSAQYLRGVVFGVLLLAAVALPRVTRRSAGPALAVTAVAVLAGVLAATALDRDRPPLDYEAIAESLEQQSDPRFGWEHRYGPITWERDGREVLRVRARRPAYWKAQNLDGFDGRRWTRVRLPGRSPDGEAPPQALRRPQWRHTIRVRVTGMRTEDVIGAGTTLAVRQIPGTAFLGGSPGTFSASGVLERGDAYTADVHIPDPTAEELAAAEPDFPESMVSYRTAELPLGRGRAAPAVPMTFAEFGTGEGVLALGPNGLPIDGARLLRDGPYRRTYALARRLAARASTPYEFVRRVEAHFDRGFAYTEKPPPRPVPLESFLFEDRAGYCQQFSGAMALMLRMGGVPARVATGFAPGRLDRQTGEYAVTVLDAHSWVEAWFPELGWVPFDPTPSETPAAAQPDTAAAASAASLAIDDPSGRGATTRPAPQQPEDDGRVPLAILLVPVAVVLLAAGLVAAARRRRPAAADPQLTELERALRRAGDPVAPGTTLTALEARFAGHEGAAAYLRSLRSARYGFRDRGPSAGQRRALRRALGEQRGALGRLRAWWALPPAPGRRGAGRPAAGPAEPAAAGPAEPAAAGPAGRPTGAAHPGRIPRRRD